MDDLKDAEDSVLRLMAIRAFDLGLSDAQRNKTMKNKDDLMTIICPGNTKYRIIHARKFRQIYGAAFDMIRIFQ